MFGSFPPSLWLVCASKVYSGLGADIVYGIITLKMAEKSEGKAQTSFSVCTPKRCHGGGKEGAPATLLCKLNIQWPPESQSRLPSRLKP